MDINQIISNKEALVDALQQYLAANDITSADCRFDVVTHTRNLIAAVSDPSLTDNTPEGTIPDIPELLHRAPALFNAAWSQTVGHRQTSRYYSADYPIKALGRANGDFICRQIGILLQQPELASAILNLPEAQDEEAANMMLTQAVSLLAAAQNVTGIKQIAKECSAKEDFNQSVAQNPPAIDHRRKVTHSRTKTGELLSLDSGISEFYVSANSGIDAAEMRMVVDSFITQLSDSDQAIFRMYLDEENQADIAAALKMTQGAVSKRLSRLRTSFAVFWDFSKKI